MSTEPKISGAREFSFGPFYLHATERRLLRAGQPVEIGSRALDILIALLEHAGEVLGKKGLVARVWPDVIVEESSLRVHVAALRKALGDGMEKQLALVWRGRRTAVPRHQTLNATLDWSYNLLSPEEQLVLQRLSIFVGDFVLAGALGGSPSRQIAHRGTHHGQANQG